MSGTLDPRTLVKRLSRPSIHHLICSSISILSSFHTAESRRCCSKLPSSAWPPLVSKPVAGRTRTGKTGNLDPTNIQDGNYW